MPALPGPGPGLTGQTRRLLDHLAAGRVNSCKVADLPTTGVSNGDHWFATDGVKDGETTGNGTGCPVYFDEASGDWKRYSDDTTVID